MITVNSNTEIPQITVCADAAGLRQLESLLRGEPGEVLRIIDTDDGIAPNCMPVLSIQIASNNDKLVCAQSGQSLVISGSGNALIWLADYLGELALERGFEHVHIEYYEGHPILGAAHTEIVLCEVAN